MVYFVDIYDFELSSDSVMTSEGFLSTVFAFETDDAAQQCCNDDAEYQQTIDCYYPSVNI